MLHGLRFASMLEPQKVIDKVKNMTLELGLEERESILSIMKDERLIFPHVKSSEIDFIILANHH